MMNRSKLAAALLAALVIAPVIAAGRPGCCVAARLAAEVTHRCCPSSPQARASAPKGCCKAPVAPKPETRANDGALVAAAIPSLAFEAPALGSKVLPITASIRLARRAHHADAPDDSPPDLLSRIHILLI